MSEYNDERTTAKPNGVYRPSSARPAIRLPLGLHVLDNMKARQKRNAPAGVQA